MVVLPTVSARRRGAIALLAVCLSALMFGLEISSIPAILPTLRDPTVLGADFAELQWIMNAYTIAVTVVLMGTGTLADRFGRRRVFVASIVAFGLASLMCGLAPTTPFLIAARALQGLGGGAMLVCGIAVLSHQFRGVRERSMAFGWWGVIAGVGLGFGPLVGGGIVAVWGWEWVFLIHVLLAVAVIALALAGVDESRDPDAGRLDLAGMATLSLSVFCLAWYITQGPVLGFVAPTALAVLAVSVASAIAFAAVERSSRRPMIDFSIFRIRAFSGAVLGSAAMNVSYWPFMIYLPIWFSAGLGLDSVAAGLGLLAYTLPTLIVPPIAERLSLRFQSRVIIPVGLFTIGVGFFLMRFGAGVADASALTILPGCVIAGVGLGLTNTPVTNTTTGAAPPERAGMASGVDMSARMISLAVNIALMGFILLEGVRASLAAAWPGNLDAATLKAAAEQVAAGTAPPPETGLPEAVVHRALADGMGAVLLFGGVSVWLFALASWWVFRWTPAAVPEGSPCPRPAAD
jgi:EmrB/QacA subfamily drug resistance transporter